MKKTSIALVMFVGLHSLASEDLLTACPGALEQPIELSQSCMVQLDERFLEQPVWQTAKLDYQVFERRPSHWSDLNNRVKYLLYSPSDLDTAPVWSDVLDDAMEHRNHLVRQSLNDPECIRLEADSALRTDLAEHCNSNDLIKYSLYIDACITSFTRVQMLSEPFMVNDESGELETLFFHSLGVMAQDSDRVELTDAYLLSAWLMERCEQSPIMPMGVDAEELDGSHKRLDDMIDLFQGGYDKALAIAAKTGNAWAQLMYVPVDLPVDSAYLRSLHEHNPLLAHRLMATDLTYGVLSEQDRIYHAVKAHELEGSEGRVFEYLTQFKFYHRDLKQFEATLLERLELELKYPWSRW